MTFDEFLQDFVNRDYDELVDIAKRGMGNAISALEDKFDEKETVAKFLILLVGTCISIDGTLTPLEAQFTREVLGDAFDVDSIVSLAKTCNDEESRELIDGVIDSLDQDAKAALCTVCISVMCVDERIASKEVSYIKRLFE